MGVAAENFARDNSETPLQNPGYAPVWGTVNESILISRAGDIVHDNPTITLAIICTIFFRGTNIIYLLLCIKYTYPHEYIQVGRKLGNISIEILLSIITNSAHACMYTHLDQTKIIMYLEFTINICFYTQNAFIRLSYLC